MEERNVYIIFLDIVSYSTKSSNNQRDSITKLNENIISIIKKLSISKDEVQYIPTGDGNVIVLKNIKDVIYPIEIVRYLLDDFCDEYNQLTIGIHKGEIQTYDDINKSKNFAGDTINMAARLMDAANENQALFSNDYLKILNEKYSELDTNENKNQEKNRYKIDYKTYKIQIKHGEVIDANVLEYSNNDIPKAAIKYKLGDFYMKSYVITTNSNYNSIEKDTNIKLTYYDNEQKYSDTVVVLLHGLGLDASDFNQFMRASKYRCITPNLVGCDPNFPYHSTISLDDHILMMEEFIMNCIQINIKYKNLIFIGFSLGADIFLDIRKNSLRDKECHFLLLDPNINRDTCFISKEITSFSTKEIMLQQIQLTLNQQNKLERWQKLAKYFTTIVTKFQDNLTYLTQLAMDTVTRCSSLNYMDNILKSILDKDNYTSNQHTRFIFSDDIIHKESLHKFEKNYNKLLTSLLLNDKNHFDLIEKDELDKQLKYFVSMIEDRAIYNTTICEIKQKK